MSTVTKRPDRTRRDLRGLHPNIKSLVKHNRGSLVDLSGNHRVRLAWDQNAAQREHGVFELEISQGGLKEPIKVYIDLEELLWYTRVM